MVTEKVKNAIKTSSGKIRERIDTIDKEELKVKTKESVDLAIKIASRVYIIDFFRRLFRKNNLGTIVFLVLNLGLYIFIFGGFYVPQMIPTAVVLYLISLCIALSPIGEVILRFQSGCRKLKKFKNQHQAQRIRALFDEVYADARENDPSISPKVNIYISNDQDINAFATGRRTVCVTKGLLMLDDDQIKGILAHEFGHLAHKDTDLLLVIYVSNLLLSILFVIIRLVAWISIWLVGEGESSFGGIGNFITRLLVDLILVAMIKLWTRLGVLLVMHSSRQNEFEADRYACELGHGAALADALSTIDGDSSKKGFWANLRSSHPDTVVRLEKIKEWMTDNGYSQVSFARSSTPYVTASAPMGMASAVPHTASKTYASPPPPPPIVSSATRPKPFVRTQYPTVNSDCYGRLSEDGRLYYGRILNHQSGYFDFLFSHNVREWVPDNCVISVNDAWQQLKPFANYNHEGVYLPCQILQVTADGRAIVRYEKNNASQTLTSADFMFICPPNI